MLKDNDRWCVLTHRTLHFRISKNGLLVELLSAVVEQEDLMTEIMACF